MQCRVCRNQSQHDLCPECQESSTRETGRRLAALASLPESDAIVKLKEKLNKYGIEWCEAADDSNSMH